MLHSARHSQTYYTHLVLHNSRRRFRALVLDRAVLNPLHIDHTSLPSSYVHLCSCVVTHESMHVAVLSKLATTSAPTPDLRMTSDCLEAAAAGLEAELRVLLRRHCNSILHSRPMTMFESAKNHALQQVAERTATPRLWRTSKAVAAVPRTVDPQHFQRFGSHFQRFGSHSQRFGSLLQVLLMMMMQLPVL